MIRELTEEDFACGVKNPYFDKLMTKIEVAVKNEDYATFCETAKINGVPVDIIMRNCLADWARKFREHE